MKTILLLTLLLSPIFLFAQTDNKPPKLRIQQGFLSTRYELGDKTTPAKDVALHLKQYEPDAYVKWKGADQANVNNVIWSLIGTVGLMIGILAEEQSQVAGYGIALIGYSASLVCTINGGTRRQKAIDIYNNKFGY